MKLEMFVTEKPQYSKIIDIPEILISNIEQMQVGFVFNSIFIGYSIGTAPRIGYHYGAKNHVEVRNVLEIKPVSNINQILEEVFN